MFNVDEDVSIGKRLHESFVLHKNRIAATYNDCDITYRQLERYSNAVCKMLLDDVEKISQGRVCILIGAAIERLCYVSGVLKAGMAYVPLDVNVPIERNKAIIHNIGGTYILTDEKHKKMAQEILGSHGTVVVKSLKEMRYMDGRYIEVKKNLEDEACIIHTSGSTGTPKGVSLTEIGILNFCCSVQNNFCHITPEDSICALTNFAFDFSLFDMFPFMLAGARIYFIDDNIRMDVEALNDFITEHHVTIQTMPTALFHLFVTCENDTLRMVIVGGEKMIKYREKKYEIINIYGPTETTVLVTYENVKKDEENIPVGVPMDHTQIILVDEAGQPVADGEAGEICIQGLCVSKGYVNNPEETKKRFVPSVLDPSKIMYKTGDIGRWREDGKLLHLGRRDFQVKIRGFRIELDEINHHILQIDGITESVVLCQEQGGMKHLCCFYAADPAVFQEDAFKTLNTVLPEYMVPSKYIRCDALPQTQNGKVDRKKLLHMLETQMQAMPTEHSTEERDILKNIWREILAIAGDFDENESFRNLGGHSISEMMILLRVREELKTAIAYPEFLQANTFAEFYQLFCKKNAENGRKIEKFQDNFEKRYEEFPLNVMQQAYLFGRYDEVELGEIPTHMYMEIACDAFEYKRFLKAANRVFAYHDALRLRVSENATQKVVPYYELTEKHIPCIDMRGIDSQEFESLHQKYRMEMIDNRNKRLDAPLVLVRLLQTEETKAIVQIYIDGFVADGWSQEVLIRDFDKAYENTEIEFPSNTHLFRDYVGKTAESDTSSHYKEARKFWLNRIQTLPSAPELPLKNEPSKIHHIHTSHLSGSLDVRQWENFEKICAGFGVTTSNAMMSVFGKVISRWCKNKKFIVNLPVANRFFEDVSFEDTFGIMSDFILFDVDESKKRTILEGVLEDQEKIQNLAAYRAFNGMDVIRELSKKKGNAGNSAPVVFTSLVDVPAYDTKFVQKKFFQTHTSQIWIDVVVLKCDNAVQFNWDFVEELFEPAVIEAIMKTFMHTMEQLCTGREAWNQAGIDIISEYPTSYQMAAGPNVEHKYEPIVHLLEKSAEQHSDSPAVMTRECVYSYAKLFSDAKKTAAMLKEIGVKKGDVVGILMEKRYEQIVFVLGILYCGAVYLPLDTSNSIPRIERCMKDANASLLITESGMLQKYNGVEQNIRTINVDDANWNTSDSLYEMPQLSVDDLYCIIYTSGSTGVPKGVALGQKGLQNCIAFTNKLLRIAENDRVISLTNLCHDMSIYDIFGMLTGGGAIVLPDRDKTKDPVHWCDLINQYHVTIWNSVPAMLEMELEILERSADQKISSIQKIISGGETLSVTMPSRIRNYVSPELEMYNVGGPTEATIWSIYHKVTEDDEKLDRIPLGKAIENVTYAILDEHLNVCPYHVPGIMYTEGINLCEGYINSEKLNKERFVTSPYTGNIMYRTGDMGMYMKNGDIDILGREDNQVKINGKRIELGEIEHLAISDNRISVAVALYDKEERNIVLFYKVKDGDKEQIRDELEQNMKQYLPDYMLPAYYIEVDSIPVTSNSKIDRNALMQYKNEVVKQIQTVELELNDDQKKLLDIYRDAIGNSAICFEDNFFAVGGDSLKAIGLVYRVNEVFSTKVQIMDVFMHPSVKEMSEFMQCGAASKEDDM